MSPYLFIIAMDPLARWLNLKMETGDIRGLKLARTAPQMACSLFADDLILMGTITDREMAQFKGTLMSFFSLSGLRINNDKSKVWFSANTDDRHRDLFRSHFEVQDASQNESYLGCPVIVSGRASFDYLVDKFEKRLNMWKAKMLTHAGRLILIKAVLESLPVYAMSTVLIPARVLKKLTAIMRNFFWGGNTKNNHMSYVAWSKVTVPKGMGGLGLRSLKEVNMALVLKIVWKIASGSSAPWADTLKAKYCPLTGFWLSTRRQGCTMLWRNLTSLKPFLQNHLVWKIGTGTTVQAFSQPWFPGWELIRASSAAHRSMTVSSLLSEQSGQWDFYKLQSTFGFQLALTISLNNAIRPAPTLAPDTLLFTFATDGRFTIKKAYQLLKGDLGNQGDKKFWSTVWKVKGLVPKLKLFIWRCVASALPVSGIIGARISSIPTTCQICRAAPESVEHMLFTCDFARAAWWASPLNLRSDRLHGTFRETIDSCLVTLSEEDVVRFVCMAWAIWRVRNEVVLGGKQQNFFTCFKYFREILLTCQTSHPLIGTVSSPTGSSILLQHHPLASDNPICYVDGSWSPNRLAGIGAYILIKGRVVQWASKSVQALNSAQVEVMAVLQGFHMLMAHAGSLGIVYTDSMETVDSLAHRQPLIHDWRTFNEVWEAWQMQNRTAQKLKAVYCTREDSRLQLAHLLANLGRIAGWDRVESDLNLSGEDFKSFVTIGLL